MMMMMMMIPTIIIMIFMGVQAREKVGVQASENRGVQASGRPDIASIRRQVKLKHFMNQQQQVQK